MNSKNVSIKFYQIIKNAKKKHTQCNISEVLLSMVSGLEKLICIFTDENYSKKR